MCSRTIVRYWSGEQTFGAANGVPSYRPFERGSMRLTIRLRVRRSSRKRGLAAGPDLPWLRRKFQTRLAANPSQRWGARSEGSRPRQCSVVGCQWAPSPQRLHLRLGRKQMLGWQRRDSERANRETTSGVQEYRPGFDALATRCSPRTALACNCGRVGLHRKKGMFGRLSFPRTETLTKTISDPATSGSFPRDPAGRA